MKKIFALFALALSLIGGNAAAQSLAATPPELVRYSTTYKSTTLLAANTADTIFTPATNTKGAFLWAASWTSVLSGTLSSAIIAHTSAPANLTTGDVLQVKSTNGFTYDPTAILARPVFIPPGKGLYFIANGAETTAIRTFVYTLIP